MKAPDKIYINGFSAFATVPVKNGVEYIRKEAILKWADEQEKELEYGISADAYKLALDMLREKLNSL